MTTKIKSGPNDEVFDTSKAIILQHSKESSLVITIPLSYNVDLNIIDIIALTDSDKEDMVTGDRYIGVPLKNYKYFTGIIEITQ